MSYIRNEDYEVDENALKREEMGNLSDVSSYNDALTRYGYSINDNIPRRELVLIYHKTKSDMTDLMNKSAKNGDYDRAVELKAKLATLREDFDNRQKRIVSLSIENQHHQFDGAKETLTNQLRSQHTERVVHVEKYCTMKEITHDESYRIKWEILEEKIDHMKIPNVKYSNRMIELVNMEEHLNKTQQYEDARRVKAMIDKLKPIEDAKFFKEFNQKINKMRADLAAEEAQEKRKLDEKLKSIQWTDIRQRLHESSTATKRFENHERDMRHTHQHELHLRPETSINPSLLWTKRKGFKETSAFNRGQQMMRISKRQDIGGEELADTLLDKHSFENPLDGTSVLFRK